MATAFGSTFSEDRCFFSEVQYRKAQMQNLWARITSSLTPKERQSLAENVCERPQSSGKPRLYVDYSARGDAGIVDAHFARALSTAFGVDARSDNAVGGNVYDACARYECTAPFSGAKTTFRVYTDQGSESRDACAGIKHFSTDGTNVSLDRVEEYTACRRV